MSMKKGRTEMVRNSALIWAEKLQGGSVVHVRRPNTPATNSAIFPATTWSSSGGLILPQGIDPLATD